MKQPMREEGKVEKFSQVFSDMIDKSKLHFVLFAVSSVFVLFSITYGQYFFQTFITFVYSVYTIHLHLARQHEVADRWKPEWRSFYHACLNIFCIMGFVIWIILILKSFLIF